MEVTSRPDPRALRAQGHTALPPASGRLSDAESNYCAPVFFIIPNTDGLKSTVAGNTWLSMGDLNSPHRFTHAVEYMMKPFLYRSPAGTAQRRRDGGIML